MVLFIVLAMGVVVAILATAAWIVDRRQERGDAAVQVDPLLIVGIAISGVGASLVASIGAGMLVLSALGIVLIVAGAFRMRGPRRR